MTEASILVGQSSLFHLAVHQLVEVVALSDGIGVVYSCGLQGGLRFGKR
jgi:hypothetical protein